MKIFTTIKLCATALGIMFSASLFAQTAEKIKINSNAPIIDFTTITINASREKVWEVMANINHWSDWQTAIKKPTLKGELKPKSTFSWKIGGAKIHSTLHTVEPASVLGWTGKSFGTYVIHNWTFDTVNGQTKVTVDESMQGFLATLFKKSLGKTLDRGNQNWLELLKKECEK